MCFDQLMAFLAFCGAANTSYTMLVAVNFAPVKPRVGSKLQTGKDEKNIDLYNTNYIKIRHHS